MLEALKSALRQSPLATPLIRLKSVFERPTTQNEEGAILTQLLARFAIPKRFVEFGFSGWEFNCATLVNDWEGLLLDGNSYNVKIARLILPKKIRAEERWLTLDTLDIVRDFAAESELGILSIDVDGNDYWFLQALIDVRPAMLILEYNSSFGRRPVTVPYDATYDRTRVSPTWPWYNGETTHYYFGASLAALTHLATEHGYSLIEVTQSGVNAFFVRNDLLGDDDFPLSADQAYREQYFPDGSRPSQRLAALGDLPLIDVTKGAVKPR
ncbi:MAG: hypothetical protein V4659_09945 [Pseudomonadota bacterium]